MQKALEGDVLVGESYAIFEMSIRSTETLKKYRPRLRNVLRAIGLNTEEFVKLGHERPMELQAKLYGFIKSKVDKYRETEKLRPGKGRPKPDTISGMLKPVKKLCVMNDVLNINWDKLLDCIPPNPPSDDRAIKKEEIQQLYKHADIRERVILTVRASSGMRVGSLPRLCFKHIQPITLEDLEVLKEQHPEIDWPEIQITYGNIVAAKVTAYDTKGRKYYATFINPEAWRDIEECRKYRERYGEKITGDSPLIRDKFDKRGIVGPGKAIDTDTIRHIMEDLIYRAGLRKRGEHKVRHEWQATHAFRKFFRTRAFQAVNIQAVKLLMGHSLGTDDSYVKPEHELLAEYLKIVPLVTITQEVQQHKQLAKIDELEKHKEEMLDRITELEKSRNEDHETIERIMQERYATQQAIEEFIKQGVRLERGSYDEEWKDERERLACGFNPSISKCKDKRWINLPEPVKEFILSMIPGFNDDRVLYGYVAVKDKNGKEVFRVHDEDLPDSL
jgi:integrase